MEIPGEKLLKVAAASVVLGFGSIGVGKVYDSVITPEPEDMNVGTEAAYTTGIVVLAIAIPIGTIGLNAVVRKKLNR
ncbi:MAG TPA: hypothetical protein VK674_03005 [Candidatus Limnocylindria bacterium]|nr:hypothetical protein [Candidatus Limnocylindria bacterium]